MSKYSKFYYAYWALKNKQKSIGSQPHPMGWKALSGTSSVVHCLDTGGNRLLSPPRTAVQTQGSLVCSTPAAEWSTTTPHLCCQSSSCLQEQVNTGKGEGRTRAGRWWSWMERGARWMLQEGRSGLSSPGQSHPSPLPSPHSKLPLFCPPTTLSSPLCQPAQEDTNLVLVQVWCCWAYTCTCAGSSK